MKPAVETVSRQAMPHVTTTQIVCGDCAGDDLLPLRTLLTNEGKCSRCGGSSFVLAPCLNDKGSSHDRHQM
jgi:hypothetical protein